MDRFQRFTNDDSKLYEASTRSYPSSTPRDDTARGLSPPSFAPSSSSSSQHIGLTELQEWTNRKEWPQRRDTEDLKQWRKRATMVDEIEQEPQKPVNGWPTFSFDKETSTKPASPEPRYNQNFLHPPTPNRSSFIGAAPPPPIYHFEGDGSRGAGGEKSQGFSARKLHRRMSSLSMNNLPLDMEKSSRFGWWTLVLLFLTVLMVTLTAVYSNGTAKSLMKDRFFTTSSANAIFILRILTECCALLLAALLLLVVEDLQWALASRPQGVSLLHFVGLDAGTGVWGLLRLLATAEWKHKFSSLFRLLVICTIPLPGIVLMGDINLELVFFPQHTYPISAGLGKFNSSYLSVVGGGTLTGMLVSMGSPAWSDRETWTLNPLGPEAGGCTVSATDKSWAPCDESHLLTGGVVSIAPQIDDLSTFPNSDSYIVPKTRSILLEYGPVHDIDNLYNNGTCFTLGSASAAAYWCAQTGEKQELLFGSAYCPIQLQVKGECLNDTSWTSPLLMTSSLFVYSRYGTIAYARSNFSVLSVTDLTPPQREIILLDDYLTALSAVVPGFRPSNITDDDGMGDNSALAIYAVTALPINDNVIARQLSLRAVRKAMSVPISYFQENYFSTQSIWDLKTPRSGLSADLYTTLSLAIGSHQVVAGKTSRWLFGLLSGLLLAMSTIAIIVTARICKRVPQRCGYPTLDFAAVCAVKGGIPGPPPSPSEAESQQSPGPTTPLRRKASSGFRNRGLHRSLTSLGQKPAPFQVASRIKDERIILGR